MNGLRDDSIIGAEESKDKMGEKATNRSEKKNRSKKSNEGAPDKHTKANRIGLTDKNTAQMLQRIGIRRSHDATDSKKLHNDGPHKHTISAPAR